MKRSRILLAIVTVALAYGMNSVYAQPNGPGPGEPSEDAILDRDRDCLLDCTPPDVEQKQARIRQQELPDPVKDAVKEMAKAREQYQKQQRELKQDQTGVPKEECDQVREQLREQLRDQVREREQIRERLQELRECLQDHQQLMEQAREQARENRK